MSVVGRPRPIELIHEPVDRSVFKKYSLLLEDTAAV